MILILNLALEAKKKYNPLGALALSAALITIIKPYAPFQVGFMLSFLATLGIVLFSDKLDRKLYRCPKFIRTTIVVSISAQVFTIPIIMACFKECSLNFIIGNLILVPILNILIVLGNFMLLALPLPFIFDFLSFIIYKVIYILDICVEVLYDIDVASYIVNKSMVIIYCSIIISIYFIIKGKRKLIILPIVSMFIVGLYIYSPLIRIDYLKGGVLLISYRGDRKIISNTSTVDMARLKKITLAKEGFREVKEIKIAGEANLVAEGKDYILNLEAKEYLLSINKKEKLQENYDIINFVDGKNKGFFILGDKLLLY
jgi:competence protein ComEC